MTRAPALAAFGLACVACTADHDTSGDQAAARSAGLSTACPAGGFLQAQLRGAVVADLHWSSSEMQCEGSPRPDGHGLRLTFAGHLPASGTVGATRSEVVGAARPEAVGAARPEAVGAARQLRFIFGIDERDIAAGAALALPTNLTVILEGERQLYATRGGEQCAVESLDRSPLDSPGRAQHRVHARGYCLGPATNVTGDARLLVPVFEFSGVADKELAP
jgi:hypothetical protein